MGKKKRTLKEQMQQQIYYRYRGARGKKRHNIKKEGKESKYITSNQSFRQYKAEVGRFATYCRKHGVKRWQDGREYVKSYLELQESKGLKAISIKNKACALGKLYQCSINDFGYEFGYTGRETVTNNRGDKPHHKEVNSDNYTEALDFIKASGLRRHEIKSGNVKIGEYKGKTYIEVIHGKGGKHRYCEWLGTSELLNQLQIRIDTTPKGEDLYHIPHNQPTHRSRQTYAQSIYKKYARDVSKLHGHERYECRKDMKGQVYNRQALYKVQKNIGHNDLHSVTRYVFKGDISFD